MLNFDIPFLQWKHSVEHHIYDVLTCYEQLVAHKAKLANICTALLNYKRELEKITGCARIVTQEDAILFKKLIDSIIRLKSIYLSLTKEKVIETCLENELSTVRNNLLNFRKTFNLLTKQLNIADSEPCALDRMQEEGDNYQDNIELQALIGKVIISSHNKYDDIQIAKLQEYLDLLDEAISEYRKRNKNISLLHKENQSFLDDDEIEEEMLSFSQWKLNREDFTYQKEDTIGNGGFSKVFLATQVSTGKKMAIKCLKKKQLTDRDFQMFKREIELFSYLQHPCLLHFVGFCIPKPFWIITEFMAGGSLWKRLHDGPSLESTQKTIIAYGIAQGMQYIHSKGMIHRDLKSLNILLDEKNNPHICDFGLSRSQSSSSTESPMTVGIGTSQWMAPEMLSSSPKYNDKADVYSYAIILWEILTEDVPFRGLTNIQIAMAVVNNDKRPQIPENCPSALHKLIIKCWDREASVRPDFKTIVKLFDSGSVSFVGADSNELEKFSTKLANSADVREMHVSEFLESVSNKDIESAYTHLRFLVNNNVNPITLKELEKMIIDDKSRSVTIAILWRTITKEKGFYKRFFEELFTQELYFQQFYQISNLLSTKKKEIVVSCMDFIQVLINKNHYEAIEVIVPNIIQNLEYAKKLIRKLLEIPEFKMQFIKYDGIQELLRIGSFELCHGLIKSIHYPTRHFFQGMVDIITEKLECFENEIEILNIMKHLLDYSVTFTILAQNKVNPLLPSVKSNNVAVQLLSLKICYKLLLNQTTFEAYSKMADIFDSLLLSENTHVAYVCASCLTFINSTKEIVDDKNILQFIQKSLKEESELTIPGIRLLAILPRYQNDSFKPQIQVLLEKSDNPEIKEIIKNLL